MWTIREQSAMTLRDYFAGQVLAGLLAYSPADPREHNYSEHFSQAEVAKMAYSYADAMIAHRNAKPEAAGDGE